MWVEKMCIKMVGSGEGVWEGVQKGTYLLLLCDFVFQSKWLNWDLSGGSAWLWWRVDVSVEQLRPMTVSWSREVGVPGLGQRWPRLLVCLLHSGCGFPRGGAAPGWGTTAPGAPPELTLREEVDERSRAEVEAGWLAAAFPLGGSPGMCSNRWDAPHSSYGILFMLLRCQLLESRVRCVFQDC